MRNIVLIGIMGTGKTTIGYHLGLRLNRPFVDMDDYLIVKHHMPISAMFDISEEYFRDLETEACADLSEKSGIIISTGGGTIKRRKNIDYLRKNGIVFYIDRPIPKIIDDVDTSTRPLLKDGAEHLYELDHERRKMYLDACDYHLINDSTLEEIIEEIVRLAKMEEEA